MNLNFLTSNESIWFRLINEGSRRSHVRTGSSFEFTVPAFLGENQTIPFNEEPSNTIKAGIFDYPALTMRNKHIFTGNAIDRMFPGIQRQTGTEEEALVSLPELAIHRDVYNRIEASR